MAPLQKRALYSLIIGLALAVTLIVTLVIKGDVTTLGDDNLRFVMYAVMIGVPLIYLVLVHITLRKPTQLDERDRTIIDRSSQIQILGIIFSIAAWTIILTEVYQEQGRVPVEFLNLIMISALIISPIAQSLGILMGYWRINRDG